MALNKMTCYRQSKYKIFDTKDTPRKAICEANSFIFLSAYLPKKSLEYRNI